MTDSAYSCHLVNINADSRVVNCQQRWLFLTRRFVFQHLQEIEVKLKQNSWGIKNNQGKEKLGKDDEEQLSRDWRYNSLLLLIISREILNAAAQSRKTDETNTEQLRWSCTRLLFSHHDVCVQRCMSTAAVTPNLIRRVTLARAQRKKKAKQ